jgi:hypothetical protein
MKSKMKEVFAEKGRLFARNGFWHSRSEIRVDSRHSRAVDRAIPTQQTCHVSP